MDESHPAFTTRVSSRTGPAQKAKHITQGWETPYKAKHMTVGAYSGRLAVMEILKLQGHTRNVDILRPHLLPQLRLPP